MLILSDYRIYEFCKGVEVSRICIYVKYIAVRIDKNIRRPCMHIQEVLDSTLLVFREIIVDDILSGHIVFLDDILP